MCSCCRNPTPPAASSPRGTQLGQRECHPEMRKVMYLIEKIFLEEHLYAENSSGCFARTTLLTTVAKGARIPEMIFEISVAFKSGV